jgi:hypothetical protein
MTRINKALLRIAICFGAIFAFLIATEVGLLSARFRGAGICFHWQVWLLAGIFAISLRDLLASTHSSRRA